METLLNRLKAVAEPTRLRILSICMQGELTVSELTHILAQSQPRVSRHLKLLCDAGLLNRFQEGAWVFYRLADRTGSRASALSQHIVGLIPENDPQLRRDMQRLANVRRARQDAADAYFRENAREWDEIRTMYVDDVEVETMLLEVLPHRRDQRMIDIGTGTGRVLELFGPRVAQSVGVDFSREMLALARSRLDTLDLRGCQVRKGDMYQLPVEDAGFDIATRRRPYLKLRGCLRPAGHLQSWILRHTRSRNCVKVMRIAGSDSVTMKLQTCFRRAGYGPLVCIHCRVIRSRSKSGSARNPIKTCPSASRRAA